MNIKPALLIDHLHQLAESTAKVSADSRQINSGDIFFAYPVGHGLALRDGRKYIEAALENGAAAVVYDPINFGEQYEDHPYCIPVENLSTKVGEICAQWYGYPSQHLKVTGVTGTNGKTSITQWLGQTLDEPNHRAAVLGTLGVGFPGALVQTGYTTPDAPRLQTQLKALLDDGANQVVMEVSSHALDQDRVSGIQFHCAVFTNLTQDHLDYHGTMPAYAQAKAKLFQKFNLEHAVINVDDVFGRELVTTLLTKTQTIVWAYSSNIAVFNDFEKFGNQLHRVYLKEKSLSGSGYDVVFACDSLGENSLHLPVLGEFNISNALAVWTVLLSQGFSCDEASKKVSQLRPVLGRMEFIEVGKHPKLEGLLVVVDYAHTPDALEKTLLALKPLAEKRGGKIWCVFGCGGDRDVSKRSKMGAIANQHADQIVITSDNPRSEEPLRIMEMVRGGIAKEANNVQMIEDRAAAIMAAVRNAASQDIVLVAGKGHETTQEIQGKKFDFSDQEHIRLAVGGLV